jgi:hypothetical protein
VLLLGVVSLMSTTRENLLKGKRKGNRSQSSEHLRPGDNFILRRIIRSQSRVNNLYSYVEFCINFHFFYLIICPFHQGSRWFHHNLCCSSSYTTKALQYYTEAPTETTQLRMLPQPTTPRLQLITSPRLSNSTLERPSTTEISQVSFSDTQHGNPEVSNKLRFKQWNGKEWRWVLYYCNFVQHVLMTCFPSLPVFRTRRIRLQSRRIE